MSARLLFVGALAAGLMACGSTDHEPRLFIDELEITGETDFGALDVEVHLFDEATRAHLGCAGADEGLEQVDASDIRYTLDAFVRSTATGDALTESELFGRSIEVIVIEDDAVPCPAPPGPDDDVVGLAGQLGLEVFDTAPVLAFEGVVALGVGLD
jgi:hypothetical protein